MMCQRLREVLTLAEYLASICQERQHLGYIGHNPSLLSRLKYEAPMRSDMAEYCDMELGACVVSMSHTMSSHVTNRRHLPA